MSGSVSIGKIFGIRVEVHFSWLIVLVFLAVSLAISWFPLAAPNISPGVDYGLSVLAAFLLLASVLVHELAHSLVARSRGLPVKSITLYIFGGVSNIEQEPKSPGEEFWLAFVGPLTNLVLAALFFGITFAFGRNALVARAFFGYLALANAILGVFNLIPGFPLDGGRVLRAFLWKVSGSLRRATRWAAFVGQIIAYLFILGGVWLFFLGNFLDGIWIGFIGWFMLTGAQSASQQVMIDSVLRGVAVSSVMIPRPLAVQANSSVQALVDQVMFPYGLRAVLVEQGELLAGIVTFQDVSRLPRERWGQTPVAYVMIPRERLHTVRPDQQLVDVVSMLSEHDVNQLPVVEPDGRVVGLLTRQGVLRFIEMRRGLGDGNNRGRSAPPPPPNQYTQYPPTQYPPAAQMPPYTPPAQPPLPSENQPANQPSGAPTNTPEGTVSERTSSQEPADPTNDQSPTNRPS